MPEELKSKIKSKTSISAPAAAAGGFDPRLFLYIILSLLGALACIHIFLLGNLFIKNSALGALNKKWMQLEPQRKMVEGVTKEQDSLTADTKLVQELTKTRLNWSEKLNKISFNLSSGIWFNELSVNQKNLILKGSTVSLQKIELSLINQFIENLKKDKVFIRDFSSLELSSIQRKMIAGYEVVDFTLTGALK